MKKSIAKPMLATLILTLASINAWSRGGGGCLEAGTLIDTPSGPQKIESLQVGDWVYGKIHGQQQQIRVAAITKVKPKHYLQIRFPQGCLNITDEHLIAVKEDEFRRAASLKVGDRVVTWQDHHWESYPVVAISDYPSDKPAYNLLVEAGGTYVANGALVHNKGCFLPNTPILRTDGRSVAIDKVVPGDSVEAYEADGKLVATTVRAVVKRQVDSYYIVTTAKAMLNVTGEHPFYVGKDTFKTVEVLRPGDVIYAYDGEQLKAQPILKIEHINQTTTVYNLQTDEPHTYFASGIAVHNKGGGCFPVGTKIRTPSGMKAIELLGPGDDIIAVNRNGAFFNETITATYATRSPLVVLETSQGVLRTTAEHPVAKQAGEFVLAEKITPGDSILFAIKNNLTPVTVQASHVEPEQLVINLEVSSPHTFIADGVVVHNKGGGLRGAGSICPDNDETCKRIALFFIALYFIAGIWELSKKKNNQELDYINSRSNILIKSLKTLKILRFLAGQDGEMAPDKLIARVRDVFTLLQKCWMSRQYDSMKPLLMPDLFRQHNSQIQGLVSNHEINRLDDMKIDNIDIVNVRYTEDKWQREFTALITATGTDYYIDDRSLKFIRGDTTRSTFQEFWTFEYQETGWLLRDIEQARESDYLKTENFVEMFTDLQIEKIYGEAVDKLGTAGPALPAAVESKDNKVERMLNFLEKSDKLWTRQKMLVRVRSVFTLVYMSFEAGKLDPVTKNVLYPTIADEMTSRLTTWKAEGNRIEYRNFCVRKVEIVLVRSFNDKSENEFTARVSAHAQIIYKKDNAVISADEDVTAFVEFWTFGMQDGEWKLKLAETKSAATGIISAENEEEGSSANLVKWYYTKKRAI